jgi:hypothetical protein
MTLYHRAHRMQFPPDEWLTLELTLIVGKLVNVAHKLDLKTSKF